MINSSGGIPTGPTLTNCSVCGGAMRLGRECALCRFDQAHPRQHETVYPCPPWCGEPAGHPFVLDAAESEHPTRMHVLRVREATAEQLELLEITTDGVTVRADEVTIFHTEDHDPWTVETATEVARDLGELAAAVQGGAR